MKYGTAGTTSVLWKIPGCFLGISTRNVPTCAVTAAALLVVTTSASTTSPACTVRSERVTDVMRTGSVGAASITPLGSTAATRSEAASAAAAKFIRLSYPQAGSQRDLA